MLDRGKDPLLLLYTYTPSSSTVGLLLHLQYYQRCKSAFLKIRGNINVFRDNQVIIIYWVIKSIRRFTLLRYSFFWKHTATISLKKFSSNTIFSWYNFGKFYIVKFNYFSGKRCFEIFLIDPYANDIANKNIAGKYQNALVSLPSTLY